MRNTTWKNLALPVEERVASLLDEMTLPEKIMQTTVYPWVAWRLAAVLILNTASPITPSTPLAQVQKFLELGRQA